MATTIHPPTRPPTRASAHPAARAVGRIDELRRADPVLRRRHLEVRTWALSRGQPVEADALTVVLGSLAEAERRDGTDPRLWTKARILEFVWGHCPIWCLEHALAVPRATPDALRVWWAYLLDSGGLSPGSDDRNVLLRTLAVYAGRPPRRSRTAARKHIGPR